MSKKVYNIRGHHYGGEVTIGRVTQEFYDYWVERDEDSFSEYILGEWEDSEDEDIPEMTSTGNEYWHDLDDILHFYGS